uniref:Uncharacterized protein n=1 Tax=Mycobacterium riyadhense TaxID=486698 RepID=A0A653EVX5_9MYCO|nr:hypothetical protein BIN_B_04058 [Mycobacterium riyadhense]
MTEASAPATIRVDQFVAAPLARMWRLVVVEHTGFDLADAI